MQGVVTCCLIRVLTYAGCGDLLFVKGVNMCRVW